VETSNLATVFVIYIVIAMQCVKIICSAEQIFCLSNLSEYQTITRDSVIVYSRR